MKNPAFYSSAEVFEFGFFLKLWKCLAIKTSIVKVVPLKIKLGRGCVRC